MIGEVLVSEEDLQRRVAELGGEVSRDYEGRAPLLVGDPEGGRSLPRRPDAPHDVDCELDFMAVSSYGSSTDSSGVVRILKDLDAAIADRDVLIVEDIIDSGLTLHYLLRNLQARGPKSVEVCALLTKPERRRVDLPFAMSASRSRTASPSATASITSSATATSESPALRENPQKQVRSTLVPSR